jgi:hypothetical protein
VLVLVLMPAAAEVVVVAAEAASNLRFVTADSGCIRLSLEREIFRTLSRRACHFVIVSCARLE